MSQAAASHGEAVAGRNIAVGTAREPGEPRRRRNYPADADVWSLRRSWAEEKEQIRTELLAGRYRFGLLARVTLKHGEEVDLWSARDALVLKALAIVLVKRHIRRRYSRVPLPQARLGRITPRPIRSTAAKH